MALQSALRYVKARAARVRILAALGRALALREEAGMVAAVRQLRDVLYTHAIVFLRRIPASCGSDVLTCWRSLDVHDRIKRVLAASDKIVFDEASANSSR